MGDKHNVLSLTPEPKELSFENTPSKQWGPHSRHNNKKTNNVAGSAEASWDTEAFAMKHFDSARESTSLWPKQPSCSGDASDEKQERSDKAEEFNNGDCEDEKNEWPSPSTNNIDDSYCLWPDDAKNPWPSYGLCDWATTTAPHCDGEGGGYNS